MDIFAKENAMLTRLKFGWLPVTFIFLILLITLGCKEDNPAEPQPNPNDNLLPGVAYMGHGYNVFGDYAKSEYVKSQLFQYDTYNTVTVDGKTFNVPIDIQYTYVNTADFKSKYGLNSYEYRQAMSINASLSGSYSFFSASVTNNYNEEYYRSSSKAFCTIQNVVKKWKLTLPYTDLTKLKSMLTDEAKSDLANLAPDILFNKYGTHFITELLIGARADYNTCVTKSAFTYDIRNNFEVCAEASFKKKSGSGSFSMVTEQQLQTFESNSYQDLKVAGGKPEYGSYIFVSGNYSKWIESIDDIENLTISDFTDNSLIPIWELCANDTRRTQLSNAFTTYAEQFTLPDLIGEAVNNLQVKSTYSPPNNPDPGYSKIDVDLNRDAGGAYINLCYKNGLENQQSISDITFIKNTQTVPTGYTKIENCLNEGCGSNNNHSTHIFLCYKKRSFS